MLTDHPELFDGMRLVPCAVMADIDNPQAGWLFIPHADGKWVSAAKLQPFSQQIINYWWNRPSSAEVRAEAQEPIGTLRNSSLGGLSIEIHAPDIAEAGMKLYAVQQPPAKQEAQKPVALSGAEVLAALYGGSVAGQQPTAPCPKCGSYAGMSWGGNNVYGDAGSINSVKEAVHYAGQVPEFKKIIQALQAKVTELEKKWLEEQALNLAEEADYELMGQQLANAESMAGLDAEMNRELRAKVAELEEALRPKPLREGLVPHAFMLEPTHNNAEFWQRGGHNEPDRIKALMCVDQAVNAWKNAAYSKAEQVMALQVTIAQQAERIAEFKLLLAAQTEEWHKAYDIAALRQNKIIEQSAMIEKCEKAQVRALAKLAAYVGVCNGDKELTVAVLPLLRESLAAIALHRSQP